MIEYVFLLKYTNMQENLEIYSSLVSNFFSFYSKIIEGQTISILEI